MVLWYLILKFGDAADHEFFQLKPFLTSEQTEAFELFKPLDFTFADIGKDHLLIINRMNHSLRLVDEKADTIAYYEAHGNGPGELNQPYAVLPSPDRIAVFNFTNGQIVCFDSKLKHLENMRVPYRFKFAGTSSKGDYYARSLGDKYTVLHLDRKSFKIKNKFLREYTKFDNQGIPVGGNNVFFSAPYIFHFYGAITKEEPSTWMEVFPMNEDLDEKNPLFRLAIPELPTDLVEPIPSLPGHMGYVNQVIYFENTFIFMTVLEGNHGQVLNVYDLFNAETGRYINRTISSDLILIRAPAGRRHFFMKDDRIFELTGLNL
jgi:hypothetical protein